MFWIEVESDNMSVESKYVWWFGFRLCFTLSSFSACSEFYSFPSSII